MPDLSLFRWLLQRITAILLVLFLAIHIITIHFIPAEVVNLDNVMGRIHGSTFWLIFYGLFLITALFHGLNGVYEIIIDYNPPTVLRRTVTVLFCLLGVAAFVLGLQTLLMFWR